MISKSIEYLPYKAISPWRKIAVGTWRNAKDPSIYGWMDFDATLLLQAIEYYKEKNIKVTPTVIFAKALANALACYPRANAVLRFGRLYQRKNIDIFLQVSADEKGEDLSGMVIRNCDKKDLKTIAEEIQENAIKIKSGNDQSYKKVKKTMGLLPGFMTGCILDLLSFIQYGLNIWSPLFGNPNDSFGSAMITSVGMLGLERGFAPLVPYSRCPFVFAMGQIKLTPVVENNQVVIKPMLPICATIDHRVIDGVGCSVILKELKKYLSEQLHQN